MLEHLYCSSCRAVILKLGFMSSLLGAFFKKMLWPLSHNKIKISLWDGTWDLNAHTELRLWHLGGPGRNTALISQLPSVPFPKIHRCIFRFSLHLARVNRNWERIEVEGDGMYIFLSCKPLCYNFYSSVYMCVGVGECQEGILGVFMSASGRAQFPWPISPVYQGAWIPQSST